MSSFFPGAAGQLSFGHVAMRLAAIGGELQGPTNPFREALKRIADHLSGPAPSFAAANSELASVLYFCVGRGEVVDTPETWLLCACMMVMVHANVQRAGDTNATVAGQLLS